jgi:DNA-binding transcriptional ArsR family regulator
VGVASVTDLVLARLAKWKRVCGRQPMSTQSLAHGLRMSVAAVGSTLASLRRAGKVERVARHELVGPRAAAECFWTLTA